MELGESLDATVVFTKSIAITMWKAASIIKEITTAFKLGLTMIMLTVNQTQFTQKVYDSHTF